MLPMYFLPPHVFSKQKEKFIETTMASTRQYNEFLLEQYKSQCRRYGTRPYATVISTLSKKHRYRKRRRKSFDDAEYNRELYNRIINILYHKLLYKFTDHQQQYRFNRTKSITLMPRLSRQIKRETIRDIVPINRIDSIQFSTTNAATATTTLPPQQSEQSQQQSSSTVSNSDTTTIKSTNSNRLCSSSKNNYWGRTTPFNSMSFVALDGYNSFIRIEKNPFMSKRKRSCLYMLQSGPLESTMQDR